MGLQERLYSVLLVSSSETFNTVLTALLLESSCDPVCTACGVSAAKRMLAQRQFDYVIVNSPLPDDNGTRFAVDTAARQGTVVMLLVSADLHEEVHSRVAQYGVFTLAKPTSKLTMLTALGWLESAREVLRRFEKKAVSLEEKMEQIRIVNRAKWLLISELKMDEPEAHRYLEKRAMDDCVSKRQIAEEIIKTYSR